MQRVRVVLELEGILQGVGFRPTVQVLAEQAGLGGFVQNRSGSVRLALEGAPDDVDAFLAAFPGRLPPRARLERSTPLSREALDPDLPVAPFVILESDGADAVRVSIPADLALCPDCRAEVFDPASRFFGYAFTTCTNCGPRYTVVDGMPYDRERTSLAVFPLCLACRAQYTDVRDRRFHAESIACPLCGPRLAWCGADGAPLQGDPLREARAAIAAGALVAVRGLGGFLLACDAFDRGALARLRERKHRPAKPFAVMARDAEVAGRWCHLAPDVRALLEGPVAPIAILDVRPDAALRGLPQDLLTPDAPTLGVMLPTTALHALLATPLPGDPTRPLDLLVMTSGNRGGEPICLANAEAFERLAGIADFFLVHDRDVRLRNDDSLVAATPQGPQVWRRARGYAPESLRLARPLARRVLAFGAELKNTIALGWGDEVVLSPHIGDLETPEALDGLLQVVARFPSYFRQQPQVVAVDLHPDLHASRVGRRVAQELGVPVVEVQHHHAHAAAALAEHGLESALALAFDGTGLGPDGAIWGAELLHATLVDYVRLGTFAGVPLPGADAAVREPVRQLVARWWAAGAEPSEATLDALGVTPADAALWRLACARGLNAPTTHAAGRLFDAAAVVAGVAPRRISYEGQAAIRLESLARGASALDSPPEIPFSTRRVGELLLVDWGPLFAAATLAPPGHPAGWALAFHRAVARAALALARHGRKATGCEVVVLTGGVWMNRLLVGLARQALEGAGFRVVEAARVPPNDGGVALGQAVVAGTLAF